MKHILIFAFFAVVFGICLKARGKWMSKREKEAAEREKEAADLHCLLRGKIIEMMNDSSTSVIDWLMLLPAYEEADRVIKRMAPRIFVGSLAERVRVQLRAKLRDPQESQFM